MTELIVRKCALAEITDAPNFAALVAEYAEESAMFGMPPTNAKIPLYQQLEAAGALQAMGAWLGDELVGFVGILYSVLPHYSVGLAVSESFFVTKANRASGAGLKLKALAEEHARAIGSPGLLLSAPVGSRLEIILESSTEYNAASVAFFRSFK